MLHVMTMDMHDRKMSTAQAPAVVVCDTHGNPIVVVVEHQPGVEIVTHREDPDFQADLARLGLKDLVKNVIVLKQPPIPSGYRPISNLVT